MALRKFQCMSFNGRFLKPGVNLSGAWLWIEDPTHFCDQLCLRACTGGYYLTSAYGAMALIKNFQEEQAARVLSSEARNTLHQWHRRRTAQRLAPSVNDFQVSHLTWTHHEHPGSESELTQVHTHSNLTKRCIKAKKKKKNYRHKVDFLTYACEVPMKLNRRHLVADLITACDFTSYIFRFCCECMKAAAFRPYIFHLLTQQFPSLSRIISTWPCRLTQAAQPKPCSSILTQPQRRFARSVLKS